MQHRKTILSLIGLLVLFILLGFSVFTVDQTEQAVITQFGNPKRVILNPIDSNESDQIVASLKTSYARQGVLVSMGAGLHFKIPFIQKATTFDRRLLRWNGLPEQIVTKDKKFIWVDCTARWTIQDPLKFMQVCMGREDQAQSDLDDIINAITRDAITKRNLIEVVRTDNRKMQVAEEELRETTQVDKVTEGRPAIVAEITANSRQQAREYGIGIHSSGILIKGVTYVDEVKAKVEDRMIEERQRIAKKYLSEGDGEYQRIMGEKERDMKIISSEAYRQAETIKGQADANATKIYADAYSKDPEFYQFWKTLELYEKSLGGDQTRLILGTDNPLFGLIKGPPEK